MTAAEHEAIAKGLKRDIDKARGRAKSAELLQEKLTHLRTVRELEERLRQHRLSYFERVPA